MEKEFSFNITVKVAAKVRIQEDYDAEIQKDIDIEYNRRDLEKQIDAQILDALVKEGLIERADHLGGRVLIGFVCSVWQLSK